MAEVLFPFCGFPPENRGCDHFMDGFQQRSRSSFFAFIHLLHQQADRLVGQLINLLPHCAYGNHGLSGNRRIIKTDQQIICRQTAVFTEQKI